MFGGRLSARLPYNAADEERGGGGRGGGEEEEEEGMKIGGKEGGTRVRNGRWKYCVTQHAASRGYKYCLSCLSGFD